MSEIQTFFHQNTDLYLLVFEEKKYGLSLVHNNTYRSSDAIVQFLKSITREGNRQEFICNMTNPSRNSADLGNFFLVEPI